MDGVGPMARASTRAAAPTPRSHSSNAQPSSPDRSRPRALCAGAGVASGTRCGPGNHRISAGGFQTPDRRAAREPFSAAARSPLQLALSWLRGGKEGGDGGAAAAAAVPAAPDAAGTAEAGTRGGQCSICLSPLKKAGAGERQAQREVYTVRLCKHNFHRACLVENRNAGNAGCPCCRGAIDPDLAPEPAAPEDQAHDHRLQQQQQQQQQRVQVRARRRGATGVGVAVGAAPLPSVTAALLSRLEALVHAEGLPAARAASARSSAAGEGGGREEEEEEEEEGGQPPESLAALLRRVEALEVAAARVRTEGALQSVGRPGAAGAGDGDAIVARAQPSEEEEEAGDEGRQQVVVAASLPVAEHLETEACPASAGPAAAERSREAGETPASGRQEISAEAPAAVPHAVVAPRSASSASRGQTSRQMAVVTSARLAEARRAAMAAMVEAERKVTNAESYLAAAEAEVHQARLAEASLITGEPAAAVAVAAAASPSSDGETRPAPAAASDAQATVTATEQAREEEEDEDEEEAEEARAARTSAPRSALLSAALAKRSAAEAALEAAESNKDAVASEAARAAIHVLAAVQAAGAATTAATWQRSE